MKSKDIDDQRLAESRAKSKQAEDEYKKVHEQTKDQKVAIAEAQNKKEAEMKVREALKQVEAKRP